MVAILTFVGEVSRRVFTADSRVVPVVTTSSVIRMWL